MIRLEIYGKRTVKLAFEFGLILSETAKTMKIELTPEISARAEDIFLRELNTEGLDQTACNFTPLVLAALEV